MAPTSSSRPVAPAHQPRRFRQIGKGADPVSESGAGRRHAVRAGSATQKLEGKDAADRCREVRVLQPQTLILLDRVLFHKLINRTVKIVWRGLE